MVEKIIQVKGMSCNSCENRIEDALKDLEGIRKVGASYSKEEVMVEFDSSKISENRIKELINKEGYETWELAAIKKQTLLDFIKPFKDIEVFNIGQTSLKDIYFPP